MANSDKHWTESFRILTPILITISIFFLGHLITITNKIDDKLFKHLTNDELHCPRSTVFSKDEFRMYKDMLGEKIDEIRKTVERYEDRK